MASGCALAAAARHCQLLMLPGSASPNALALMMVTYLKPYHQLNVPGLVLQVDAKIVEVRPCRPVLSSLISCVHA